MDDKCHRAACEILYVNLSDELEVFTLPAFTQNLRSVASVFPSVAEEMEEKSRLLSSLEEPGFPSWCSDPLRAGSKLPLFASGRDDTQPGSAPPCSFYSLIHHVGGPGLQPFLHVLKQSISLSNSLVKARKKT